MPIPVAVTLLAVGVAGTFMLAIGTIALISGDANIASFGILLAFLGVYSLVVAWGVSRTESWIKWPGIAYGVLMFAIGVLVFLSGVYIYGLGAIALGAWLLQSFLRGALKFPR